MVTEQFNAYCPFEIGDKIKDTAREVHTITDIACIHYVRTGKVEFRLELDHSGQYAPIEVKDAPPVISGKCKECFCRTCQRFGTTQCCDGENHCEKCITGQEMKYCPRRPGAYLPGIPTPEENAKHFARLNRSSGQSHRDCELYGYCRGPSCPWWRDNPAGCARPAGFQL